MRRRTKGVKPPPRRAHIAAAAQGDVYIDAETGAEVKHTGGFASARNMFQAQTNKGESAAAAAADGVGPGSAHSNLVCGVAAFNSTIGPVASEFTTSSLDGKIAFWTRDEITAAMGAMAIN